MLLPQPICLSSQLINASRSSEGVGELVLDDHTTHWPSKKYTHVHFSTHQKPVFCAMAAWRHVLSLGF
jgi:hypothetical protein